MDKNQKLNKQSNHQNRNNKINKLDKKYIDEIYNNKIKLVDFYYDNNKGNNKNKMSHFKAFSYPYRKNIKKNKDESNNFDLLNKKNSNFINLTKIYNNEKVKQKKKKLILKSNTLFSSLGYNSADNLFNIKSIEKTNKNFDEIIPIKKEDYISTFDFHNNESTDMIDNHKKQFNNYFLTENNSYNSNLVISEKKNNYLTEETDIEYLNKLNERHYEKKNCSKQTLTPKQYHEIDELIEKDNYRRIKEKKLKEMNKKQNDNNKGNINKKLKNKLNCINNNDDPNQNNSLRSNNECDICAIDSKNCVIF